MISEMLCNIKQIKNRNGNRYIFLYTADYTIRAIMSYAELQALGRVVHGTKICEGNIWEDLLFQLIRDTGRFTEVVHSKAITLNTTAIKNKGERKTHKVDIFCKHNEKKEIFAFNSKGKSFNNTESAESLLNEYTTYKKAIETEYPGFSVVYAVLKDEYDAADTKMTKYNYLETNGIPVYNSAKYIKETFGISTEAIEAKRQSMVMDLLKQRFRESGLTIEQVRAMLSD